MTRAPRDPRDPGDRLGPPRVEPLPDIAWMRIERELWSTLDTAQPSAPPRRRETRAWWFAVPAIAVAAAALLWIGLRDPSTPTPSPILADGAPARVVSGDSSSALTFGDAHIMLDARSAVAMNRDIAMPIATLERGAAWFTISPREGRSPFVVVAGDVFVRVIGTRFHVAHYAEHVTVEVDRGVVEVQFRGSKVQVRDAERWSSVDPTRTTPRIATSEPTNAHGDLVARSTVPQSTPPPTASPATDASTTPPPAIAPSADHPPTVAEPGVVQAPVAPSKPSKSSKPKAVDPDRTRYEQLSQLEATDPAAALQGYLALSRRTGPWADPALYAAARLATDRKDRNARDLVTAYLRRFPRGANVADARKLLAHLEGDSR